MSDDWRLRIDLHDDGHAARLSEALSAERLEHDLQRSFRDSVVVSVDGPQVFCYADTREQAQATEAVVQTLAREHGWSLEVELTQWHAAAERWENPNTPLSDDAESAARRQERIAQERAESERRGYPEYEVRIECAGRTEAGQLAGQLETEGIPNVRRYNYVLVGATDEDSAAALAARLKAEAPTGSTIVVEPSQRALYDDVYRSPFAVLGGLGG